MNSKATRFQAVMDRANTVCEMCGSAESVEVCEVSGVDLEFVESALALCTGCQQQMQHLTAGEELDLDHLNCLRESAWSPVPALQVLSYRLLSGLVQQSSPDWAIDLLGMVDFDEEIVRKAKSGMPQSHEEATQPKDANGQVLIDGDSVVIQKDLDVKGANFVAKRGTVVKNIRVIDDVTHIEGKVNGVSIYLKTAFLKKV